MKPLDEDKAVALGADLFGELIVFGVCGALIIYELHRKAALDSAKAAKLEELENERKRVRRSVLSQLR